MNIDQARAVAVGIEDWFYKGASKPNVTLSRPVVRHNSRSVYIDTDGGWVYKIGLDNVEEVTVYERCKDMALFTTGLYRLPLTFNVGQVLVQEYIEGWFPSTDEWDLHQWALEEVMRCGDIHDQNVIFDGLNYWIIDMGFDLDAPAWV